MYRKPQRRFMCVSKLALRVIGLSMLKEIVERMKAKLKVNCEHGSIIFTVEV